MNKILTLFVLVIAWSATAYSQTTGTKQRLLGTWATTSVSTNVSVNPVDPVITNALQGEWTNELGSILKIAAIDAGSGLISGSYKSPSGGGWTEFPLIGWVNTKPPSDTNQNHVVVVSFSVRWGQIGSVTAWNGYYNSNASIVGQWLLSRPNTGFIWDHVLAGQDRFTR
jgi:hypothetical protein